MSRVVEIRTYQLRPGTQDEFGALFVAQARPLLERWGIDVVAFGPSLHDETTYFLMRSFASVAERERVEELFYASGEWRDGPRAAIMACIESYTTLVLPVDEPALASLRALGVAGGPGVSPES